jgi:hypothetical protein
LNITNFIIVIFLILGLMGFILLSPMFNKREQLVQFQNQFDPEYDLNPQAISDDQIARIELDERLKPVDALGIPPLSSIERERYLTDWAAIQTKFVDEPEKAIEVADRIIIEVMKIHAYPVPNIEQQTADVSVDYPALVTNYRAARVIAIKNKDHKADNEELRQAIIYYRSLFEELLDLQPVVA